MEREVDNGICAPVGLCDMWIDSSCICCDVMHNSLCKYFDACSYVYVFIHVYMYTTYVLLYACIYVCMVYIHIIYIYIYIYIFFLRSEIDQFQYDCSWLSRCIDDLHKLWWEKARLKTKLNNSKCVDCVGDHNIYVYIYVYIDLHMHIYAGKLYMLCVLTPISLDLSVGGERWRFPHCVLRESLPCLARYHNLQSISGSGMRHVYGHFLR